MKQFDVFSWQAPRWPEAHPCVVVSHPDRANRKEVIEVVLCSTHRANRKALAHEVILDQADGLDWATLCKCDLIYAVERSEIEKHPKRGHVIPHRQAQLVRTLIGAHGWAEVL